MVSARATEGWGGGGGGGGAGNGGAGNGGAGNGGAGGAGGGGGGHQIVTHQISTAGNSRASLGKKKWHYIFTSFDVQAQTWRRRTALSNSPSQIFWCETTFSQPFFAAPKITFQVGSPFAG